MIKVLTIVLLGWLYVQSTESFGISSFGKANTETPKPVTPTPLPGKNLLFNVKYAMNFH
ncbi:hypothetical protein RR46_07042 [Papilio xuthus]|uniref:Uncharacterized protein n=1 Tax=Papilio xuthus TaxID=66420 RepID=A0A194Q4I1_PAPXU|nr:hypothetical protein RR46_07042 [Papilio xuthus]